MYCIEQKHCLLGLFSSSPIDLAPGALCPLARAVTPLAVVLLSIHIQ